MNLLRAEYRKLSRRMVFPVMTLVLVSFVALGAFFLIVFAQIAPDMAAELPVLERPEVFDVGAQQAATQTWFPLILAAVLLGGELSTTVWATSLTRDARVVAQLLARFVVYSLATIVAIVIAFAVWVAIALIFSPGEGFMSGEDLFGVLWKSALITIAWTSLGTGAVAMLRSVGPAIGAGIAIYFAESFLALWGPWENVSLTAAATGLFTVDLGGFGSLVPGGDLSFTHQLLIIAGWTVLGLGLTWWGLQRRDA